MFKKAILISSLVTALIVIGMGLYVFRPWADHQGWRLFHQANPFIGRVHTHSNWDLVSPYRTLTASERPRNYERALADLSEISYEFGGNVYTAADYFARANLVGLMVLYDGKVVAEKYDQGVTKDTTYMVMSSTKSFTATMVGMALKDGVIEDLYDKVEKYAPQYDGTAYGETPIKHLLMMSSGIAFYHPSSMTPNRRDLYFDLWIRRQSFDQKTANWEGALNLVKSSFIWLPIRTYSQES